MKTEETEARDRAVISIAPTEKSGSLAVELSALVKEFGTTQFLKPREDVSKMVASDFAECLREVDVHPEHEDSHQ